jgi:hypothetical protein
LKSLVSVLCIDPIALADAKSTTIVWSACLYRQLATYYEKFIGDFAVRMPRNNLPRREREEAYPTSLPAITVSAFFTE